MLNKCNLSIFAAVYRTILLLVIIILAASNNAIVIKNQSVLLANILIFLWLLPIMIIKFGQIIFGDIVQPIATQAHHRVLHFIFIISITLFILLSFQ